MFMQHGSNNRVSFKFYFEFYQAKTGMWENWNTTKTFDFSTGQQTD